MWGVFATRVKNGSSARANFLPTQRERHVRAVPLPRCAVPLAPAASDACVAVSRPIFVLQIKAELEGVASFRVPPESVLEIDVKQSAGDEERKGVQIDPEESHEVPNSKNATANFMVKFPGDKAPSTMSLITLKGLPFRAQTADDTGMVPIAAFECRGMEPTKWHPTGYYVVEALSGTVYDEVGFKDGEDWCEYDEKSGESMMVSHHVENRPRGFGQLALITPRQRQIKLRAASRLGQPRPGQNVLACRPFRPLVLVHACLCFPHRRSTTKFPTSLSLRTRSG